MLRIFEALPTQTRGREFAQAELPADAHSIALNMSREYPEFLYTIEGVWNDVTFAVRYQAGHKLAPTPSEILAANNNPIIAAYIETTQQSEAERIADEMFISPEDEWLEYIEKGLIGFDYTTEQASEARAFILTRKA